MKDVENIVAKLAHNGAEVIQIMTDYRAANLVIRETDGF